MIQISLFSQSREVRHAVWFPLHGMESSLPPILPHGSSVIPPSLSPCIVFRDPTTLCRVRLFDVNAPSTLAPPDCCAARNCCNLEFLNLQPIGVWEHMDKRGMSRCSMVEDLGLQLVRDRQSDCFSFLTGSLQRQFLRPRTLQLPFFLADR
jgi:hypothetical protein